MTIDQPILVLASSMESLPLLTTIAAGFAAAWVLGLLTQRLGLSPIVGYLLAGIVIGPHTPGFTGDVGLAQQLAEIGVILLMFGVGLHFHLKDLWAVKGVALPGAVGQSLVATIAAAVVFRMLGWSVGEGVVLGMAMAVASTVVLLRVLMDRGMLNTSHGHVAVGWLIVEDVLTVLVLVLLPIFGGDALSGGMGSAWPSLSRAEACNLRPARNQNMKDSINCSGTSSSSLDKLKKEHQLWHQCCKEHLSLR